MADFFLRISFFVKVCVQPREIIIHITMFLMPSLCTNCKWVSIRENLSAGICEQQRHRPACAHAQSDLRLLESIISRLAMSEISMI